MPPVEGEAAVGLRYDVDVIEVEVLARRRLRIVLVHETVVVALELRVEVAREEVEAFGEAMGQIELETPEVSARANGLAGRGNGVLRVVREALRVVGVLDLPELALADVDHDTRRDRPGRNEAVDLHPPVLEIAPVL